MCYVFMLCFYYCVQAFNPDNEYHFKNRMKACQRNWAEVFGDEANMFAVSPSNTYQKVRDAPFTQSHPLPLLLRSVIRVNVPIYQNTCKYVKLC